MRQKSRGAPSRSGRPPLPASRCQNAHVAKIRTTLTIDEEVWKAVRVHAARTGERDGDVIEADLRRHVGFDLLERIWARADMSGDEAMGLALEAQAGVRRNDGT